MTSTFERDDPKDNPGYEERLIPEPNMCILPDITDSLLVSCDRGFCYMYSALYFGPTILDP